MQRGFLFLFLMLSNVGLALEDSATLNVVTRESDRIVRGRVKNLVSKPGSNEYGDQLIYTDVYIGVAEALKGERSDLILTVEGGTVNGITLTVSDAPEFVVGEEVLVFAKKDLLSYRPPAGLTSKYTISTGDILRENGVPYGAFKKSILQEIRHPRGVK